MAQPIIEVKNLSKNYEFSLKKAGLFESAKGLFKREKKISEAVKDISFDISEGEFVGFIGPNGAGKTTTLKMLSGILTPTAGAARVLGFEPWQRQAEYQRQFALVMGQKNQLWWDLPAIESFLLNKEIYGISEEQFGRNLEELTKLLRVGDIIKKPVRQLSLGERMKCELIAALLHNPKVLFLDEPTIGLDVIAQKNIRDFLRKYNQERKTTILLTSHYMADIAKLCSRVIVINLGGIIYDGPFDELAKEFAAEKLITVYFEEEAVCPQLEQFGKVLECNEAKAVLSVPREQIKQMASAILAAPLPVRDIDIGEVEIESVIRRIFTNKDEKIPKGAGE